MLHACFFHARLLFAGLILFPLAVTGQFADPSGKNHFNEEVSHLVVHVPFQDTADALRLAGRFEPMESKYDKGYLVFYVDSEEYARLDEEARKLGLSLLVDKQASQEWADRTRMLSQSGSIAEAIPGFSCYRTVEETLAAAEALVAARPDLATWTDIGDSWEKTQGLGGYDIMVLQLTNSAITGPKPKLILSSAIHAREYTTAELCTRLAELMVAEHGVDADITWILDHHEVHFILQLNPDGRKQAETGILWRKNTNQNYCGATSTDRGADLNRNLPYQWGCCGGSSSSECSTTYRGAGPASEPETQALRDYLLAEFPDQKGPGQNDPAPRDATGIYFDVHSSGQLVLWTWGFTTSTDPPNPGIFTLGRKVSFSNDHSPQDGGLTDGTTKDFAYGELGVAAYTLELGTQFFEDCSVFEDLILDKNIQALLYAAKACRTPYITPYGPDSLNLHLNAGFSAALAAPTGSTVALSAVMDDTRYYTSPTAGAEPTQNVAAAEYYVDIPPWDAGATAWPMNAADGAFDSGIETVTASIDTTGLSDGRHILFVRGQDANGDWGAVTAHWLYVNSAATFPTVFFEDNFETDKGWTVNPGGTDTATTGVWQRTNPEGTESTGTNSLGPKQLDNAASGSFDLVTGATAGSSVGANDIDSGVTSIRSPDISLPAGVIAPTLSFSYYMAHTANATSDDFLRVTAVGGSSQVVFEETGQADDDDAQFDRANVDLSAFAGQTFYLLIEAADAASGSIVEAGIDNVAVSGAFTGVNSAPAVDAGSDQTITIIQTANLDGTVTDDGLPNPPGAETTTWSVVSGPGTVTFGNTGAVDTTADFSLSGVYVLRLSADDSDLNSSDDVTITVNDVINSAPTVDAGTDQTVNIAAGASLDGTVSDDGLPDPPGAVTATWSQISGPGSTTFGNANAVDTTASFSAVGIYVLQLEASDSALSTSDTVTVTVNNVATWTTLTYDDFESGWGSYTDGGRDCARVSGSNAHQGSWSIRIRDNTGSASSFFTTNGMDLTGYSELKIEFWYYAFSMDNVENFFVEFWDGSSWQIIADYVVGVDFSNNTFSNPSIIIDNSSYTFTSGALIRIRCDASGNNDQIYVDELDVSAR